MSEGTSDERSTRPASAGGGGKLGEVSARVSARLRTLPRPLKVLLAATLGCALLIGGYLGLAPLVRNYAVLYSELDREDAAAVVAKLKERQVPYRLRGDGTTVEVPEDQVRELRLALAASGLPRGGQLGFESFRDMRLGATEFEQQVTYRTAMEGELARTIASIEDVQGARVHLVLPKKSVFARQSSPARASVVVRMKSGRRLDPEQVRAIVYLVAQAVPALRAEQVALVTSRGETLHRPRRGGEAGEDDSLLAEAGETGHSRSFELALEERTRAMLERVLGPGHVEVRVHAEIDRARIERKSDHYDPKTTALRSEQLLVEGGQGGELPADTVAGVPGAESNLPTGDDAGGEQPEATATAGGAFRRQHTRNWEIDHVQERRVSVTQSVKRLAVAVVVDGVPSGKDGAMAPRPQEEIDKIAALVKSAVGFDAKRGDQLSVESVPFHSEPPPPAEETASVLPIPPRYKKWVPLATRVGLGLCGLVALLWLRRRWKRWRQARAAASRRSLAVVGASGTAGGASEAVTGAELPARQVDYRVEAVERARLDPPTAALVIRHWLGTEAHADGHDEAA